MAGNKKISELTSASSISGGETSEVVQSGTNKKVLKSVDKEYFKSLTFVSVTSTPYAPTATLDDQFISVDCDTAGSDVTINLPTAVGNKAKISIQKIDSGTNKVIIDPSGTQTINGDSTKEIRYQYTTVTLVSDNTNWKIL